MHILKFFVIYIVLTFEGNEDKFEVVPHQKLLSGKSIMEIKHASETNAGLYMCVAQNDITTIKTNGIVITVSGKHNLNNILFRF